MNSTNLSIYIPVILILWTIFIHFPLIFTKSHGTSKVRPGVALADVQTFEGRLCQLWRGAARRKRGEFNIFWGFKMLIQDVLRCFMWVKQGRKPPMTTGNVYNIYKNGDDWGMVCYCFAHNFIPMMIKNKDIDRKLEWFIVNIYMRMELASVGTFCRHDFVCRVQLPAKRWLPRLRACENTHDWRHG